MPFLFCISFCLLFFTFLTQKAPFSAFSRKAPFITLSSFCLQRKQEEESTAKNKIFTFFFRGRRESNPRPLTWQANTLTSWATSSLLYYYTQAKRLHIITKQRINMKIVGCEKTFICLIITFYYFKKKDQDQSTKEKLHVDLLKAVNKKKLTYLI